MLVTYVNKKGQMKTQTEQIKNAMWAYLIPLSDTAEAATRWQVYLLNAVDGLAVLWPDGPTKGMAAQLITGQVYVTHGKYPTFHWRGRSDAIAKALMHIDPYLRVYVLGGGAPQPVNLN
jgi:hypothetical protein